MKTLVIAAAVMLLGLVPVRSAERPGNPPESLPAALSQKLVGTWQGQNPCAGTFVFRRDGTYELTGYGPGSIDSAGTWKVWQGTLPAVLVLACRTSDVSEEVSKSTELMVIRLDRESLSIQRGKQTLERYTHVKK